VIDKVHHMAELRSEIVILMTSLMHLGRQIDLAIQYRWVIEVHKAILTATMPSSNNKKIDLSRFSCLCDEKGCPKK